MWKTRPPRVQDGIQRYPQIIGRLCGLIEFWSSHREAQEVYEMVMVMSKAREFLRAELSRNFNLLIYSFINSTNI